MTPMAWTLMLTVWVIITGATVYCFYRLMSSEHSLDNE